MEAGRNHAVKLGLGEWATESGLRGYYLTDYVYDEVEPATAEVKV